MGLKLIFFHQIKQLLVSFQYLGKNVKPQCALNKNHHANVQREYFIRLLRSDSPFKLCATLTTAKSAIDEYLSVSEFFLRLKNLTLCREWYLRKSFLTFTYSTSVTLAKYSANDIFSMLRVLSKVFT